jgi:hypothetical protein
LPDEGVELSAGAAGVLATLGVSTTLDEGASEGVAASEGVEVVSDIQGFADLAGSAKGYTFVLCLCPAFVHKTRTRHPVRGKAPPRITP